MSAIRDTRSPAKGHQHLQVTPASGAKEKNLIRGNSVVTLNQIYQHQNSIPIRNRILSTAKSLQQQSVDVGDEQSNHQLLQFNHHHQQQQQQQQQHQQSPAQLTTAGCTVQLGSSLNNLAQTNSGHGHGHQNQQVTLGSSHSPGGQQSQAQSTKTANNSYTVTGGPVFKTTAQQQQQQLQQAAAPPPVRVINVARRYRRKSRQLAPVEVGLFELASSEHQQQQDSRTNSNILRQELLAAGHHLEHPSGQAPQQSSGSSGRPSWRAVANSRLGPSNWSSSSSATSSTCSSPTLPMRNNNVTTGAGASANSMHNQHQLKGPTAATRSASSPRSISPALLVDQHQEPVTSAGGAAHHANSLPTTSSITTNSISAASSGQMGPIGGGGGSGGLTTEPNSSSSSPARRRVLPISPQQSLGQHHQSASVGGSTNSVAGHKPVIQQQHPSNLNRQMSAVTIRKHELTQQVVSQQQQQQVKKHRKLPLIPNQLLKQQTIGANLMASSAGNGLSFVSQSQVIQAPSAQLIGSSNLLNQQQQQQQTILRQDQRQQLRVQSFPMPASPQQETQTQQQHTPTKQQQQQQQPQNINQISQLYQTAAFPAAQRSAEMATSPSKRAAAWQAHHPSGSSGNNSTDTPSPRSPLFQTTGRRPTSALATNSKLSTSSSSNTSSKSPMWPTAAGLTGGGGPAVGQQQQQMQPLVTPELDVSSHFTFEPDSFGQATTGQSQHEHAQHLPMRSPGAQQHNMAGSSTLETPEITPRGRRLSSCGLGLRANFLMNKQHAISEFTPPRSLESSHSRSSTDANWPGMPAQTGGTQQTGQQQLAYDKQVVTTFEQQQQQQTQRVSPQHWPTAAATAPQQQPSLGGGQQLKDQLSGPARFDVLLNRRPSGHGLPQRASSASETITNNRLEGDSNNGSNRVGSSAGFTSISHTEGSGAPIGAHLLAFKVNPVTRSMIAVQHTDSSSMSLGSGSGTGLAPAGVTTLASDRSGPTGSATAAGWQTWRARHQQAHQQQTSSSLTNSQNHDDRLLSAMPIQNALSIDVYQCNSLDEPNITTTTANTTGTGVALDHDLNDYSATANSSHQLGHIMGAGHKALVPPAANPHHQRSSLTIQETGYATSNSTGHLMPHPQRDRQPSNVSTSSMPVCSSLGGIISLSAIASSTSRMLSGLSSQSDMQTLPAGSSVKLNEQQQHQQLNLQQQQQQDEGQQQKQPARKFGAWVEQIAAGHDDDSSGKQAPRARSAQLPAMRHSEKRSRATSKGRRGRAHRSATQRRPNSAQPAKHGTGSSLLKRGHHEPGDDSLSSSCLSSSDFSLSTSAGSSRSSPVSSPANAGSSSSTSSSSLRTNRSMDDAERAAAGLTGATAVAASIGEQGANSRLNTGSAAANSSATSRGRRGIGQFSIVASGARKQAAQQRALPLARPGHRNEAGGGQGARLLSSAASADDKRDQLTLDDRLKLAERSASKLFRKVDLSPQRSVGNAGASNSSSKSIPSEGALASAASKLAEAARKASSAAAAAAGGRPLEEDGRVSVGNGCCGPAGSKTTTNPAKHADKLGLLQGRLNSCGNANEAGEQGDDDDLSLLLSSVDKQLAEERRSFNQSNGSGGPATNGPLRQTGAASAGPAQVAPNGQREQDASGEGGPGSASARASARAKSVLSGVSLDRSTSAAARALRRAITLRSLVRNFSRRTSSCDSQPTMLAAANEMRAHSMAEARNEQQQRSSTSTTAGGQAPASSHSPLAPHHLLSVANDMRQRRSAESLLVTSDHHRQQRLASLMESGRDVAANSGPTTQQGPGQDQQQQQRRYEAVKSKAARLFRLNSRLSQPNESTTMVAGPASPTTGGKTGLTSGGGDLVRSERDHARAGQEERAHNNHSQQYQQHHRHHHHHHHHYQHQHQSADSGIGPNTTTTTTATSTGSTASTAMTTGQQQQQQQHHYHHRHRHHQKHESRAEPRPTSGGCHEDGAPPKSPPSPATNKWRIDGARVSISGVSGEPSGRYVHANTAKTSDERSKQLARMKSVITAVTRRLEPLRNIRNAAQSKSSAADHPL